MFGKRVLVVLIVAAAVSLAAPAQEKPKDAPKFTGAGQWVVVKEKHADLSGKSDTRLADFPTEEAAKAYAAALTEKEPWPSSYIYTYRKALAGDHTAAGPVESTGPKGGLIQKPELKTVDPGAIKLGSKAKPLAGMTGTGEIGGKKVMVTFSGKDGKGKFKVDGELTGEGEWQQDGAGVTLETELSRFRGAIRGDKVAGFRFAKKPGEDGKNAMTEWSVTLAESPKSPVAAGTAWKWTGTQGVEGTPSEEFRFLKDGVYEEYSKGSLYKTGTWRMEGEYIRFEYKFDDGRSFTRKSKIEGDKLTTWFVNLDGSLDPINKVYGRK